MMAKNPSDDDSVSSYIEYIDRMNKHWEEIEKLMEKMRFEFNSLLCSKHGKALKSKR